MTSLKGVFETEESFLKFEELYKDTLKQLKEHFLSYDKKGVEKVVDEIFKRVSPLVQKGSIELTKYIEVNNFNPSEQEYLHLSADSKVTPFQLKEYMSFYFYLKDRNILNRGYKAYEDYLIYLDS